MIVSKTPLRFSLIGGGSDLPEYWRNYGPCEVISMALDVYMYVTVHARDAYRVTPMEKPENNPYGSRIRVSYTQTENVDDVGEIKHDLVREALTEVTKYPAGESICRSDYEITTICDIPSRGSGLGSSASLLVGLFRAMYPHATPAELVSNASHVEIDILKRPVGWQDQLAAAHGGLKKYHIDSSGKITITDLGYAGKRLAEHLLAFRLPPSRSESSDLSPKHETLESMERHMESRSWYLARTVEMVSDFEKCLIGEDIFWNLGLLLHTAWGYKRESHAYHNPLVDGWYDAGTEAGALGGKVSGSLSGGTGHLFFFCEPDKQEAIRKAMPKELVELRVGFSPNGSIAIEL
jgi:D-glycero-alpha-D-manno-heptose-7-phosphate kinase